jgi:hypothetical protein
VNANAVEGRKRIGGPFHCRPLRHLQGHFSRYSATTFLARITPTPSQRCKFSCCRRAKLSYLREIMESLLQGFNAASSAQRWYSSRYSLKEKSVPELCERCYDLAFFLGFDDPLVLGTVILRPHEYYKSFMMMPFAGVFIKLHNLPIFPSSLSN